MALTTAEVARLAALARIDLSQDELAKLAPQLDVILDAVAQVYDQDSARLARERSLAFFDGQLR